ncbi:MAG TPA: hypothetical protein VMB81_12845, partial [Candidatus Sulfotelmatobacter sp.]|nr:hypothetical protein [Candidatus Sulfotelmatobacter sp.]
MRFWRASTASRARARSLAVGVALGASIALAWPVAAARAEAAVTVRSGEHDGYGRLVFDWPKPVRFDASVDGNHLIIRFNAPLTADLGAAAIRRLDNYVTRPVLGADRRSVTFELVRPVTLRSFQNERSAVIDLIDQPAGKPMRQAAAPPAAPQPEAAKPEAPQAATAKPDSAAAKPETVPASAAPVGAVAPVAAPTPSAAPPSAAAPIAAAKPADKAASAAVVLPVRVGEHDDFTRLKFDWPQAVEYHVEASAGHATITFDRPAQIDVAALRDALPRSVAQPEVIDNGAGISFAIPRTAEVRHFRSGLAVVLDVLAPPDAAPAAG